MELKTPPPFMEKSILNFHFYYLTISLTSRSFELAFPKARITSVKPTKQESVISQWVTDKGNQWSELGPTQIFVN